MNIWMIIAIISWIIALAELVFIWHMIAENKRLHAEWFKEMDKADAIILKFMKGEW